MSILEFLCVLWHHLETLLLKLTSILGDGTFLEGSWIHPEHRLQPTNRCDPFYCTACKEIGFGHSYSCDPCMVHVHKECMSPPPTASHPLPEYPGDLSFVRSVKTYDTDTDTDTDTDMDTDTDSGSRFCRACSKQLRGCGYMSAGGKISFHPCCLHLDRFIKVNGEKLKLKKKNTSSKCNWCKTVSIRARRAVIPCWSYVSVGKDRRFHVGCIQDMMRESWRDGGIDQPVRGKEEDNTTNCTPCLSFKIKLPIDPAEERDADPLEVATKKVADLMMKDVRDGNNPSAAAMADQLNKMIELLRESLQALTSGVGSGSGQVWEVTKAMWRLLLLRIRQWIARLADTPVGRARRKVWTTVRRPSKLWELIRPLVRWLRSKLCESASRMLNGTSSPHGRLRYDAHAYSMDPI